jgi:hypothetical protein
MYLMHKIIYKRDSSMWFSTSGFFHKSVVPRFLIYNLRHFQILPRIRRDIHEIIFTFRIAITGK